MVTVKKQRGEDGRPFRKIKNANLEPGTTWVMGAHFLPFTMSGNSSALP